jgi:hypothetical protein
MTRVMYDSVSPDSIPDSATIVAGYVDGHYANMPLITDRFPGALHVPIAVRPSTDNGLVLDVETGDATPAEAPGWVTMRRNAGVDPTVYCNSSTWGAVKQAFADAGVPQPHYWIAQYDNNPAIPAGAIAKQYGGNNAYDVSSVADTWPGLDNAGDTMTPQQISDLADVVVERLLARQIPCPGDTPPTRSVAAILGYQDLHYANLLAAIKTPKP